MVGLMAGSFPDLKAVNEFFGADTLAARTWAQVFVQARDGYRPEFCREDMIASVRDYETASNYDDAWARVACPALLVLGENSWIEKGEVRRMQCIKPSLVVEIVANAGHDAHLDSPTGWRTVAESFLRQLLEQTERLSTRTRGDEPYRVR